MLVTIYLDEENRGKMLNKNVATSILCDEVLLSKNSELELAAECRDNKYYRVKGTNTVLLHVEEGFCIFTDYMVGEKNLAELIDAARALRCISVYGKRLGEELCNREVSRLRYQRVCNRTEWKTPRDDT